MIRASSSPLSLPPLLTRAPSFLPPFLHFPLARQVDYFKPVELYTKDGLKGNITMSVGTHGRMKAHFDRPIQQNDTVCLPLYKRVFPKWGDCYAAALSSAKAAAAASSVAAGEA